MPLLVQCRVCEYAGCIWIVVVIVVSIVTAIADSSSTDKTIIVFIFQMYGYEIFKFYLLPALFSSYEG
jgi:hypothetical protein